MRCTIAPYGIEVAANIFGRQGYPFPIYRTATVGVAPTSENLNVLVSPKVDAFRLPNIWDTDIRFARAFAIPSGRMPVTVRIVGDVFNLFNANTGLTRVNLISNAASGAQERHLQHARLEHEPADRQNRRRRRLLRRTRSGGQTRPGRCYFVRLISS